MWNKKEISQVDTTLTRVLLTLTFNLDLRPWLLKVKLYLGNGCPYCHGTKGTGVDRMPWCETLRKWVNWTLRWLGYLWPWPLTFKVKLYLGNGRTDCHGTKGTAVDKMPWCETQGTEVTWNVVISVDSSSYTYICDWEANCHTMIGWWLFVLNVTLACKVFFV